MSKRVFIVHGWGGYPAEGWFPWLKNELEARGFEVFVPQLPDADNPRIDKWVPALAQAVGVADSQTYFVGHSMGCQTIVRYLETLQDGVKVGGAVFVAGFLKPLIGLEDKNAEEIHKYWHVMPFDFEKLKLHLPKSIAIFSDDDPLVSIENAEDFKSKLGSEIIVEHQKGHFSGRRDGAHQVPIVLEKLLRIQSQETNSV